MDDLISREYAIDLIEGVEWYHLNRKGELVIGSPNEDEALYRAKDIFDILKFMSGAKEWTPISEGLPEIPEGKQYVTVLCYSRIHFVPDHVDEQDWYYGYEIATYYKDFGWERLNDVIEWMYLPEPPELPKEG